MPVAHAGSQSAFCVIGGYIFPSHSTLGVQMQRSDSGMESMTCGMCLPQPHQEEREQVGQVPRMHILLLLGSEGGLGLVWCPFNVWNGCEIDMSKRAEL
jgi:hypothetical protein